MVLVFPPSSPGGPSNIDLSALSGIAGSISIACWVVVFSPQIIENFRRRSADGLSVVFIAIWLVGDVFNILGSVLQGVLPTMVILAVYYTLADVVLLGQVWYYRGFTLSDADVDGRLLSEEDEERIDGNGNRNGGVGITDGERRPLLAANGNGHVINNNSIVSQHQHQHQQTRSRQQSTSSHQLQPQSQNQSQSQSRTGSFSALRRHLSIDGSHLSPATPLLDTPKNKANDPPSSVVNMKKLNTTQSVLFNTFAILLVCAAGVLGWYISQRSSSSSSSSRHDDDNNNAKKPTLHFDLWGQIFGYLCATLYLGSRVPQLLLNYRRKSTEGVSMLFFLFACIGNLTYDLSIFAFDATPYCTSSPNTDNNNNNDIYNGMLTKTCGPGEKSALYVRYIAVNASWIAGSLGTLLLDLAIFVQFFLYRVDDNSENESRGEEEEEEAVVVVDG